MHRNGHGNAQLCTMKTLLLVRHAKSSWEEPGLRDFDRPLSPRGKRDAPRMAALVSERYPLADQLVSSPAQRAQDTAVQFAKAFGLDPWDIRLVESVYEALPDDIQNVVESFDDAWNEVLLFGHNPGLTIFANRFSEGFRFDNIPTCGVVAIHSAVEHWNEFRPGVATVDKWMFPKECVS